MKGNILGWWLILTVLTLGCLTASAAAPRLQIKIEQISPYFLPNAVTVMTGVSIRWENGTNMAHTIVSDTCFRGSRCVFDSGIIPPHSTYEIPQLLPGRYTYHCSLHPFMRGTLTVIQPTIRPSEI